MAPTRADLDAALAGYWQAKGRQLAAAQESGSTAEGSSKAVRGGGHFEPIVNLLARFFLDAGYPASSIGASGTQTQLPGYFRPTKNWDLVVIHREVLVAAIELKALGGPSFGNNFNNRVEEALGNAVDLSQAALNSLTGRERPWLGYFFVMDDQEGSRRAQGPAKNGRFPVDPIWELRSYQERFAITGERLLGEGHYDAICYLVTSPDRPTAREPSRALDWEHFSAAIEARLSFLSWLRYP